MKDFQQIIKKVRLVPAKLISPDERPDDKFPLSLQLEDFLEHWHTGSMTVRSKVLSTIEPQPYVHLSRNEMKKNNFSQDEKVELSTRRGKLKSKSGLIK